MNNIKNKKNKDVYLNVKYKRANNKRAKTNAISKKYNPRVKEPEIPIVQEYLDIALSCNNMFQYIFENKFFSKRYYYTILFLTFYALIMNYCGGLVILGIFRMPEIAYEYECFSLHNYAYEKCTFRDLCQCHQDKTCVSVCYDSRLQCREYFVNFHKTSPNNILKSNNMSNELFIRFMIDDSKITIFNKIQSNFCEIKYYCIVLIILLFLGGSVGLFVSGILADYYGKRKVILGVSLTIILESAVTILFSRWSVNEFSSLTSFFTAWGFISFFSGISLFALEYLVLLNFMEFYPDSKSLKHINAYMHSQFSFTNMSFVTLNAIIKNLFVFYYVSIAFYIGFFLIFFFYFVENPRFYSERRDYEMKMKSIKKILQKVLIKNEDVGSKNKEQVKDEIGNHEAYWKELVITNVTQNKQSVKVESENIYDNVQNFIAINSRTKRPHLIDNIDKPLKYDKEWNKVRVSMYNQKKSKLITADDKDVLLKNFNYRKEIVLNERKQIFNQGFGNEELDRAIKPKKHNVLELFKIYRKFFRDKFVKKYFLIFLLLWVSIIYCFYGATFCLLFQLANPNKSNLVESYGVVIYSFLVILLMPFLIGKLSGYIPLDDKYFVMMTILVYSLITIFLDSHFLLPDADRMYFFSSSEDNEKYKIGSISISTSTSLIITTVSLFNLLMVTSVPTAYRTVFVSSIKSFGNLIPIFSYLSFYMLDTPILTLGIISLCGFLIFFSLQFKWRDVKLVESVDNEDLDFRIDNKIKNKTRKTNSIKSFKIISHTKTILNRASIFNRVKKYS